MTTLNYYYALIFLHVDYVCTVGRPPGRPSQADVGTVAIAIHRLPRLDLFMADPGRQYMYATIGVT